jgi:hypothetical protein
MPDDNYYSEREKLVIDLYKNQNKSIREIAKIAKMSFRDIGLILKKAGLSHGITTKTYNDKKSHSNNEKATQAYKLFDEGKKPIEVAIELHLRQKEASKLFSEFWKLKRQYRLYKIYPRIEHCLPSFLKLHKALKKRGLNPKNVEWFVELLELGIVKLPELQGQYQKLQDKVQGLQNNFRNMQYRMQESERHLQYNQQRIMEQTDAVTTLQQSFDISAEKVSNLYKEKYWLERSVSEYKNMNKK